ncbi:hypothetical protein BJ170DRAFT_639407 [Xylariales sp. AK1849]|nr:hypothetical protein BJ170DRAFT_639407 [Xylariales sp. AK1849]
MPPGAKRHSSIPALVQGTWIRYTSTLHYTTLHCAVLYCTALSICSCSSSHRFESACLRPSSTPPLPGQTPLTARSAPRRCLGSFCGSLAMSTHPYAYAYAYACAHALEDDGHGPFRRSSGRERYLHTSLTLAMRSDFFLFSHIAALVRIFYYTLFPHEQDHAMPSMSTSLSLNNICLCLYLSYYIFLSIPESFPSCTASPYIYPPYPPSQISTRDPSSVQPYCLYTPGQTRKAHHQGFHLKIDRHPRSLSTFDTKWAETIRGVSSLYVASLESPSTGSS